MVKKQVKEIGDLIINKLEEIIDNNDYNGFEHVTDTLDNFVLSFEAGSHTICVDVIWSLGVLDSYEVTIEDDDKNHPNLEENVESYIKDKIDFEELYDVMADAYNKACEEYDEWNEHGFASASDYYSWRYG